MSDLPFIPYVKHSVTVDDGRALMMLLGSGAPLTQGPAVEALEADLATLSGAKYAVAVNSGTAALHLAYLVSRARCFEMPAISFVATANAALYCGASIRYVDVERQTGRAMWDRSLHQWQNDSGTKWINGTAVVGSGPQREPETEGRSSETTTEGWSAPQGLVGGGPITSPSPQTSSLATPATTPDASTPPTSSPAPTETTNSMPYARGATRDPHRLTASEGTRSPARMSTSGPTAPTPSASVGPAPTSTKTDTIVRVGVTVGGVPVDGDIVDACHGPLRHLGRIATCFSLHAAKHVSAGEGGAIVTDDEGFAQECRLLRSHGRKGTEMVALGFNYRLPDTTATLARSQIRRYYPGVTARQEQAARYDEMLRDLALTPVPHPADSHRHLYQVLVENRDVVQANLRARNIGTAVHYPVMADQPYYLQEFGRQEGLEGARYHAAHTLSLPLFPGLREDDQVRVVEALKESL